MILHLSGRINSHTCDQLQETIHCIFRQGCFRIILDLAGIEYFSSAGLGVVINSISTAQENGGNVVMLKPSVQVSTMIGLIGLGDDLLTAYDLPSAFSYLGPVA